MKKRLSIACVLAAALTLAISGVARADTTLGSLAVPAPPGGGDCDGAVIAEWQSDPATPYIVPSAGTITSWRVNGFADPDTPITLVVLKNTGGINYKVVGVDTHITPDPVPEVLSFTVTSPIAVSGGEILGLYEPETDFVCYFHGAGIPATDGLIALDTSSTPAAGQALAQSGEDSGPGYRLNLEATLSPPATTPPTPPNQPTHHKKCKKHKKKHKRSAGSAKKKKCKKKKRK